ncbi:hypothetical protein ACS0TY_021169 [Phlomoides rotata]
MKSGRESMTVYRGGGGGGGGGDSQTGEQWRTRPGDTAGHYDRSSGKSVTPGWCARRRRANGVSDVEEILTCIDPRDHAFGWADLVNSEVSISLKELYDSSKQGLNFLVDMKQWFGDLTRSASVRKLRRELISLNRETFPNPIVTGGRRHRRSNLRNESVDLATTEFDNLDGLKGESYCGGGGDVGSRRRFTRRRRWRKRKEAIGRLANAIGGAEDEAVKWTFYFNILPWGNKGNGGGEIRSRPSVRRTPCLSYTMRILI